MRRRRLRSSISMWLTARQAAQSAQGGTRQCLNHFWGGACRGLQVKSKAWMKDAQLIQQGRDVLSHMAARTQKERYHANAPAALRHQAGACLDHVGAHELQKGEFGRVCGRLRTNLCQHGFEGLGPGGIAGTVCEQEQPKGFG